MRGLRAQILGALVLVAVGGMVSVGVLSVWRIREVLVLERHDRAAAQTELAADLVAELAADGPSNATLAERLSARGGRFAQAVGAEDLVVFAEGGAPIWPAQAPALGSDGLGQSAARAGLAPHPVANAASEGIVLYAPARRAGRVIAVVRARFDPLATVDATLVTAQTRVIWLAVLNALVLVAAAAWVLRASVVQPVRELERAAGKVAAGDLTARIEVRGPGELGRLADAFDGMTRSLREGRESLIRSEKLASVGRLAAGVAHEVGNPLAAILGYTETMLTDSAARPIAPELRRDMLERVRAETERIHRIIRELLDYSRPPSEALEAVELGRVVDVTLSLVKAQARARGVEAEVALPADLPKVSAAPGRLSQVLLNLLLNAVDAMAGSGAVHVSASVVGDAVVLAIEDDGPGVPPELRTRIFDPFFTTKEPGAGTGLGLSVSQSIVESMGGTLGIVEPRRERGARFEVRLRRA
jgi:signal transduction histidine kinase